MSKVDAMRALREAKYARGGKLPDPTGGPRTTAVTDDGALCGHRNMGGKSCSRPAGHGEKSHRYATG
jgi:hypothetical protein